jgi:pyruvate/2-oxoglutarate dehydrogenase complex dihydrolipoamide acyltransferase (E2) component
MARTPVYMPKFGMTMTEGLIVAWLRQEGDHVEPGEALLNIETEKATADIEAPAGGTLVDVRYSAGLEVPVGEILAYIDDNGPR